MHVKTSGEYEVLAVGLLEKTLEEVVVYQDIDKHHVWVRPLHEFMDGRFIQI